MHPDRLQLRQGRSPFLPMRPAAAAAASGRPGDSPEGPGGDPVDGLEYQPPPQQDGGAAERRTRRTACGRAPKAHAAALAGTRWPRGVATSFPVSFRPRSPSLRSFDGKWEALIENFNVFLRPPGSKEPASPLSFDGSEGNYYTLRSVAWSPDSKKLVGLSHPPRLRPARFITSNRRPPTRSSPNTTSTHLLTASPATRWISPIRRFSTSPRKKEIEIDHALFPNPYNITPPVWWKDSRAFTFEYNQRGHQVYRVIEVDAQTGKTRPLIDEESKTFIYYNLLGPGLSAGRQIPPRPERRQGNHLGLGARWLGASLSLRRHHRQGEKPDHQGRLAGAQRRLRGRRQAPDLVRSRRHDPRPGSLFHAILPHQLRRHRPDQAHRRRRHAHGHLLARPQILRRYLAARGSAAGGAACAAPKIRKWSWIWTKATPRRCWPPASSFPKSSSPRAATARPISGASSSGPRISIPPRNIR